MLNASCPPSCARGPGFQNDVKMTAEGTVNYLAARQGADRFTEISKRKLVYDALASYREVCDFSRKQDTIFV